MTAALRSLPTERPLRVAIVGNYPPRRCGIATYTRDVATALRKLGHIVHVTAVSEPGSAHDYRGSVDTVVAHQRRADYRSAGRAIAGWQADVVLIQHEFGIFGGPAGAWIADLMDATRTPSVVQLHTVLTHPTAEQARAMGDLRQRARHFTVMGEHGRTILDHAHGYGPEVTVIPHGTPDRQRVPPHRVRRRLGWPERPTLLTFGLISPGKGIETVIRALPTILKHVPDARYLLLGMTHPALIATEGERYRDALAALARDLGVDHALHMEDRYVADDDLCDALQGADVFVTPYLGEAQITSGALAYALGCGVPCVSTPFWHAQEVLPPQLLFPFGDEAGLAAKTLALLTSETLRNAASRSLWSASRPAIWSTYAQRLEKVLRMAAGQGASHHIAAE